MEMFYGIYNGTSNAKFDGKFDERMPDGSVRWSVDCSMEECSRVFDVRWKRSMGMFDQKCPMERRKTSEVSDGA